MKKVLLWGGLALVPACALGQQDAVVVTATRAPQPSLEVPASIDRIYPDEIRDARPQVRDTAARRTGRIESRHGITLHRNITTHLR